MARIPFGEKELVEFGAGGNAQSTAADSLRVSKAGFAGAGGAGAAGALGPGAGKIKPKATGGAGDTMGGGGFQSSSLGSGGFARSGDSLVSPVTGSIVDIATLPAQIAAPYEEINNMRAARGLTRANKRLRRAQRDLVEDQIQDYKGKRALRDDLFGRPGMFTELPGGD